MLDAEKLKEEEEKRKKEEKIKSKFVGFFIKKENTTSDNKKVQFGTKNFKLKRLNQYHMKSSKSFEDLAQISQKHEFL